MRAREMALEPVANRELDRAPRAVGRYRLEERLGGGGMGEVYRGTAFGEAGFTRTVAIKRLRDDLAGDPTFVAMLLDEARLASCIRSPNVAATYDVVSHGGEFFIVMDYVDGRSLDKLMLANGAAVRLPIPIAAFIVIGILDGLAAAHTARDSGGRALELVHRDVSPHNVLIGNDGSVRIIDFGIAKAAVRLHQTQTGEIKGKPSYMAPEQMLACPLDARADLFAVGVMLWEMLTGARFRANERFLARMTPDNVVKAPLAGPPSELNEDLSVIAYDPVVVRAIAFSPLERFASAAEMAVAVRRAGRVADVAEVKAWLAGRTESKALNELSTRRVIESSHVNTSNDFRPPRVVGPPMSAAETETETSPAVSKANDLLPERARSRARHHGYERTWRAVALFAVALSVGFGALTVFRSPDRSARVVPSALETRPPSQSMPLASAPTKGEIRPAAAASSASVSSSASAASLASAASSAKAMGSATGHTQRLSLIHI